MSTLIYLYVKQHEITGLKYFGKTMKRDPFKYLGSGEHWVRHIRKHGKEHVRTLEIWGFDDQELCTLFALAFSEQYNIVKSKEWANLRPENGLDGLPANYNGHMTAERRKQHSARWKTNNPNDLPGARERISKRVSGENNPAKRPDVREKLKGPRPDFLPHNHYTGWDQKVKDKLSESLTGHVRTEESITKQKETRKQEPWCWVNNGTIEKYIPRSQLIEQPSEFVAGRLAGRKIINRVYKTTSEERAKSLSAAQKQLKWMHDGINKPTRVHHTLIDQFLLTGFKLGRGPKHLW